MAGIGFRVRTKIERAPKHLAEQFAKYPTGNIVDAMGRFGAMDPGVKPVGPGMKFAGSALTVRIRACDNLVIYTALELASRATCSWSPPTTSRARPPGGT